MTVVHPERLAELIRHEIKTRFAGDRGRAAAFSGLKPIWLARFLDPLKRSRAIERRAYDALSRLVATERSVELVECVFPKTFAVLSQRYGEWLRESLIRSSHGGGYWIEMRDGEPHVTRIEADAQGLTQRDREREILWAEVRQSHCGIASRLEKLFVERPAISERLELAKRRVLDPLIEAAETGFVEPSWRSMRRADLHAVLMLGVEREEKFVGKEVPADRITRKLAGNELFRRQRRSSGKSGPKAPHVDVATMILSQGPSLDE